MKPILVAFFILLMSSNLFANPNIDSLGYFKKKQLEKLERKQYLMDKDITELNKQLKAQGYVLIFLTVCTIGTVALIVKKEWFDKRQDLPELSKEKGI